MNILLANKFFFMNGGSETVYFQERNFLRGAGATVIDFAMHHPKNEESRYTKYFVGSRQYNGTGVLRKISTAASFVHSPEAVRNITALIEAERPDILHCHNIYHQLTPSIIGAAKKAGLPVVMTLHDYKPVCPTYLRIQHGQPCSKCMDGDFLNVIRHRCADRSLGKSALLYAEAMLQKKLGNYESVDRVIAPSRFMADSVANRFPKNRIEVIYNGIDVNAVTASDEDAGYALYLGRISREKGVATLLEAYGRHDIPLPLKICGTGPLAGELARTRPGKVEFLGYQTGEKLRGVIRKASMICVPSEWYENCPMSVLEAMAHGKPVVGARIGGIPELVQHGVTGFLHEPGNANDLARCMTALGDDAILRKQMGQAARKCVEEKFSLDRHNESLMGVYQALLKH